MYSAANKAKAFPVAEDLARRGMNLPSSARLKREEVAYVCEQLRGLAR
jgi:dTDP-4-amino-4,6-dideoxygalactose transaminase